MTTSQKLLEALRALRAAHFKVEKNSLGCAQKLIALTENNNDNDRAVR